MGLAHGNRGMEGVILPDVQYARTSPLEDFHKISGQISILKKENDKLKRYKSLREEQIKELRALMEVQQDRLTELEQRLDDRQEHLVSFHNDVKRRNDERRVLLEEIQLKNDINLEQRDKITLLENDLSESQKTLEKLQLREKSLQEECKRLSNELSRLQKEMKSTVDHHNSYVVSTKKMIDHERSLRCVAETKEAAASKVAQDNASAATEIVDRLVHEKERHQAERNEVLHQVQQILNETKLIIDKNVIGNAHGRSTKVAQGYAANGSMDETTEQQIHQMLQDFDKEVRETLEYLPTDSLRKVERDLNLLMSDMESILLVKRRKMSQIRRKKRLKQQRIVHYIDSIAQECLLLSHYATINQIKMPLLE